MGMLSHGWSSGEFARNGGIRLFWAIILLCSFHERVPDDLKVTITHANLTIRQFSGTLLGLKRGRASSYFLVCVDLSQNPEIWLIFWDVLDGKIENFSRDDTDENQIITISSPNPWRRKWKILSDFQRKVMNFPLLGLNQEVFSSPSLMSYQKKILSLSYPISGNVVSYWLKRGGVMWVGIVWSPS